VTPDPATPDFPIVVAIGASAGGVEALSQLVSRLPAGFPAPVLVVLHVPPAGKSVLPEILGRQSKLAVRHAVDGEPLSGGHVYVAPPDEHLTVRDGRIRLTREPRENGHRPAVDPAFRAVAGSYGPRAVGVILSGARDDGSRGLAAIKAAGGRALVQDPSECLHDGMPQSAIQATRVDSVLAVAQIAEQLIALSVAGPDPPLHAVPAIDPPADVTDKRATRFTCPGCGGVLFEVNRDRAASFECSVGHAYGLDSLQEEQARQLESALWAAVRSLEDRAVLLQRLARGAKARGEDRSRSIFEGEARDVAARAALIRTVIARPAGPQSDVA
jgi:two-component system, chemotaxis family, protein-glutamate methylesterase/glutaminase